METKLNKPVEDCEVENPAQFCRQAMDLVEMKWCPLKKCSMFFLLFLVLSFASTLARLRNNVFPSNSLRSTSDLGGLRLLQDQRIREDTFWCDRSDNRTDICYMRGDVHLVPGNSTSLVLYSTKGISRHGEEIIWPYARKWDALTLKKVKPVVLKDIYGETPQPMSTLKKVERSAVCDVVHRRPLLVFSAGGFTGNPYHDFNDVLIPLFINSRAYAGEIVFGVTDARDWWLDKFSALFKLLSNHNIINTNTVEQIHCFREATVGLRVHGELEIYPPRMAHNETIKDFQRLLHQAFGGSDAHEPLSKRNASSGCRMPDAEQSDQSRRCRQKLVIFARKHTRKILNQEQVVKLAQREGFEVEMLEPSGQTDIRTIYRSLQSADVMIGVHGAALTHMLFMRPRSVFIQIVPLGTAWPAHTYYQEPAENKLDLQYLEYRVTPEESTLTRTYGVGHPALIDPEAVVGNNWEARKRIYLEGQDVRLSLPQLKLTLREAKLLASEAFPRGR